MPVPEHLTTVARNARALATRGDLRGAQAMLDQALEPATTTLGPDHPEVLAATRLLASLHRDLGDLSGARRLLEEALAAGQFTLGEDSPALLPLSYDLATLADELGNRHEARRNFTRLLRHGPAALGADHEYVRAARRYLGVAASPEPATAPPPVDAPLPQPPPTAPLTAPTPPLSTPPPYSPPPHSVPRAAPALTPPTLAPSAPSARPAPAWPPLGAEHHHDEHRHSRAPLLALVLVAAMALLGGGIAAFLVLRAPGPRTTPGPTASATLDELRPPGDLELRDDGSSITLTWVDPSKGTVPFVVAGGRANSAMNPLGSVESGKSTYTLHGISATVDFCFLVAAVYSPERTVPSALVCTQRASKSPSPRR